MPMRRCYAFALASLVLVTSGCATFSSGEADPSAPRIPPFSTQAAGPGLPDGWQPWRFAKFKKPTAYDLVEQDGKTVLRAQAEASASGLIYRVRFDPRQYPIIRWRWKVPALIEGANNSARNAEDSPVRVVVAFDGDPKRLGIADRVAMSQFRMLTKQQLPYATIMYIWENQAKVGTVIPNGFTARIQMVVADTGAQNVGVWRDEQRNLLEDYRKAFGEDPPPVKWIGVMTDTDNTRQSAKAYYGDIRVTAK